MSGFEDTKKILASLGRDDLSLQDCKSLEEGRAVRVLATYASQFGPPNRVQIQQWLSRKMGDLSDKIFARTETINVYPERAFLTFILEAKQTRAPLTASASMTPAGMSRFIDASSNVWSVVKGDNGISFLVKNGQDPVEQMIEAKKAALKGGATRKAVLLASIDSLPVVSGGFAAMGIGDLVDFYHGSLEHRGRVKTANANGVKIESNGDTFTVDPQAVIQVVEKSPASETEDANINRKFWSLVYPANPQMVEIVTPDASIAVKKDNRPGQGTPLTQVGASAKFAATSVGTSFTMKKGDAVRPQDKKLPAPVAKASAKPVPAKPVQAPVVKKIAAAVTKEKGPGFTKRAPK